MPSLESLPIEIIDTIVPLLDINSLFNLCHCLPYLKPLSKAIYDVSKIRGCTVDAAECFVWPAFRLDNEYWRCPSDSYFAMMRSGETSFIKLVKMLNRFNGSVYSR
ncbi:hypothetical protein CcCBS67573_g10326, partial [Chytriomyces confervae]